jgi:hypothetical protein
MTERLKVEGKLPDKRERLMILVMVGRRTGRHFFRSQVGMGSRLQCLLGQFMISL